MKNLLMSLAATAALSACALPKEDGGGSAQPPSGAGMGSQPGMPASGLSGSAQGGGMATPDQ